MLPSPDITDRRPHFPDAAAELAARFGDDFTEAAEALDRHADSAGWLPRQVPQAVVYAHSSADIRDILLICGRHGVAVIPFGGGTSIEGQVNAPRGGVCVDVSRMDKLLAVSAENLTVRVQPGLRREQLNDHIRPLGLLFPVDPGANATVGGMAATRASGTRAVGYDTMRENVACARVMLASGTEIAVGTQAVKSAAGYDLLPLFIGSEGTLGIFTELTLRVYPIPEQIQMGSAVFSSVAAAVRAVIAAHPRQHGVTRIELLDIASIRAANQYSGLKLPESVHLFFELSGPGPRVADEMQRLAGILRKHGAEEIQVATDPDAGTQLWQARHDLWNATHAAFPGKTGVPTDVCVPLAKLAECIDFCIAEAGRAGLAAPLCGHVGDGNFHTLIMVDPSDPDAMAQASAFSETLARKAIELGGTCSGEHGVGQGKLPLMSVQHGAGHQVMAQIKQALDPQGILNPEKIVGARAGVISSDD